MRTKDNLAPRTRRYAVLRRPNYRNRAKSPARRSLGRAAAATAGVLPARAAMRTGVYPRSLSSSWRDSTKDGISVLLKSNSGELYPDYAPRRFEVHPSILMALKAHVFNPRLAQQK